MKRLFMIALLLPSLAFAGRKVPVTIDEDTGLIYPRTIKGHAPDLPTGTTKGGSSIGGGGGSGTVTSISSGSGSNGLTLQVLNPNTTPVLTIGGTLFWSSLNKSGSNLTDLAIRNFSALQNKPTTIGGYGITDALSVSGPLNLSGFSSVTGRIANSNLPLGTRSVDASNKLSFDATARTLYAENGTTQIMTWDSTGTSFFGNFALTTTGYSLSIGSGAGGIDISDDGHDGAHIFVYDFATSALRIGPNKTTTPSITITTIYGDGDTSDFFSGKIVADNLTANRLFHLPDAPGTFALTTSTSGIVDSTHIGSHVHAGADITGGTVAFAHLPTGTSSSTVAIGNHTHAFSSITSPPTTLSGYGITDAAAAHVTEDARTGTSETLVLSDDGKLVSMTNASSNTLTIPTNASVAFPVGTRVFITQGGAGTTTIAAAGGVTLHSRGSLVSLAGQYGCCSIIKQATNTWLLAGDLQ